MIPKPPANNASSAPEMMVASSDSKKAKPGFWNFVKKVSNDSIMGPNGYDPVRILFAIGGTNGVIAPVGFQIWAMWGNPLEAWDVTSFCLAYGGMLGAIVGAGGVSIGSKDKKLAQATVIRDEARPRMENSPEGIGK